MALFLRDENTLPYNGMIFFSVNLQVWYILSGIKYLNNKKSWIKNPSYHFEIYGHFSGFSLEDPSGKTIYETGI